MSDKKPSSGANGSRQLDEQLLELTALFEISRSLTSTLSLHSILENILRIPMGHMLIARGVVFLQKGSEEDFHLEELKGLPRNLVGKSLHIDNPPTRAMFVNELTDSQELHDFCKEFSIELILPLNSSRGAIGIIGYGEKIGGKSFEEQEVEFLDSLSNIAATSVTNGIMVEEIQSVNRNLDRKIQQLNTIFDISRELNMTLDQKKIASLMSFALMGELFVNKCAVFTKQDGNMEALVAKGVDPLLESSPELCEISEPILLDETKRFKAYQDLGFAVLVPMRVQDETKGLFALGPKISNVPFDEADLEFLTTLGNQAMTSLENARLFEETLEKQRMEEELNLANSIQQGLLPSEIPQPDGYEIAGMNIPSRQVGGDYFDVIQISEKQYGIVIADVSGKGAGAALLMANLQASFLALASAEIEIGDMVSSINNLIYRNTGLDKFITFFYGKLDLENNVFIYCNAGHNPPYKVDGDQKIEELTEGGIILGMMPNMPYETGQLEMKPGDRIIMFTDGITEAMDPKDEEYGEERLIDVIGQCPNENAQELMDKINKAVDEFADGAPQADDITMVVMRATPT